MDKRLTVKQSNRKEVLDLLRKGGESSIADLHRRCGISKTTIKKVLDFYREQGIVLETGKGGSSDEGGKRPALFRFNKEFGFIASLHVGPGFIRAILTDLEGGILHSVRLALPAAEAKVVGSELVRIIQGFRAQLKKGGGALLAVVLGLPGIVDPRSGISIYSPHYSEWGSEIPLLSMVKEGLGFSVPFYCDNVNRFQALAERELGCAGQVDNFLILDAIEEGVGAGIVSNGTIRHGAHNLSGEIGHMILAPEKGYPCICGGRGCFEAMVSRRRIEELLREGRRRYPGSSVFQGSAECELPQLFLAAERRDPLAREVLEDVAHWFALGLNSVILVNDPRLIVIQGIYTAAGEWFRESIREELNRLSFPRINRKVDIVYSALGPERGVLGGAVYAIWEYFETTDLYGRAS